MEDASLKFNPVLGRDVLGPLSMFQSIAGTSWTYS